MNPHTKPPSSDLMGVETLTADLTPNMRGLTYLTVLPDGTKRIQEGSAQMLFSSEQVFYNPIQEFNRDLSITAINAYAALIETERQEAWAAKLAKVSGASEKTPESAAQDAQERPNPTHPNPVKLKILEALSASGLRSVRYAKEIPTAHEIITNDFDAGAVESIRANSIHNKVEDKITPSHADANQLMYSHISGSRKFDVIDLDPYGSAATFLDGAVQAVANGGLLCITCTDMAVLAGSQVEACWAKYGSQPIPNSPYCHEMGLRILLNSIQTTASKYRRSIEPLASFSIDFYIRVFVRVFDSRSKAKLAASKSSMIYACNYCKSFTLQPIGRHTVVRSDHKFGVARSTAPGTSCPHCEQAIHIGGPFYSDSIHNLDFISRMRSHIAAKESAYGTYHRMNGMLTMVTEELPDSPFYYAIPTLATSLHISCPPILSITSALLHKGYRVSDTHAAPCCFKTTAPSEIVWDVMRGWVQDGHPINEKNVPGRSPARVILAKRAEESKDVNFTIHPEANPPSRKIKLLRFQEKAFWGPATKPSNAKGQKDPSATKKRESRHEAVMDTEAAKKTKTAHDQAVGQ